jgi:hypothetical protein
MHDEFCTNKDDDDDCRFCRILKMVRRDEQDKFSGDEEWDRSIVEEESYARGFAEGQKSISPPKTSTTGVSLETIHKYVLEGVASRNTLETQALYNLYMYLGGK